MNKALLEELIDSSVNDRPRARALLNQHPELRDARYLHGETALHFIAVEGFGEALEFLAEEGFDLEATNEFGNTALVEAVVIGNERIVATLLRHGANPNASTELAGNALAFAIQLGRVEIVNLLLDAGADASPSLNTTGSIEMALELLSDMATKTSILSSLERHGYRP